MTPSSSRPAPSEKREQLIETALALFAAEGIVPVGIDRILAEAGVAKATLYKHFPRKDDLVEAVLERAGERADEALRRGVAERTEDPQEGLLAIFDLLAEGLEHSGFRGCLFHCAAAEYPGLEDPVQRGARREKGRTRAFIEELARATGKRDWRALAGAVFTLYEGALARAGVERGTEPAREAREAARRIAAATH